MLDFRNSMIQVGALLIKRVTGRQIATLSRGSVARWMPVAAVLVIAGCSWFSEEPTPPAPTPPTGEQATGEQAKSTPPAPGEGEGMQNGSEAQGTAEGTTPGTAPGTAEGEAKTPDINSVPTEAPKPSIVNLGQAQEGLGSDTTNAQHTDETLTMPNETAERPAAPTPAPAGAQAAENGTGENQTGEDQTAEAVQPTAPETPPAPPAVTPEATTPAPAATGTETAPAPQPAPAVEPAPAPAQVALAGTPQPGSKPFEPSGPLYLAPGSLARNTQEAAAASSSVAAAPMPATTLPPATPAASGTAEPVSVDYSALGGGVQGGSMPSNVPASYQAAAAAALAPAPAPASYGSQIAGVGQAIGYVYFGNDSSNLSAADRRVLRQVAQLQRVQGGVLRIVGHASQRTGNLDALAQDEINRRVSLARATAVARALVNMGVAPTLVQVAAAGDNQTLYAESTPAGEAGNRRAEVYLSQN